MSLGGCESKSGTKVILRVSTRNLQTEIRSIKTGRSFFRFLFVICEGTLSRVQTTSVVRSDDETPTVNHS